MIGVKHARFTQAKTLAIVAAALSLALSSLAVSGQTTSGSIGVTGINKIQHIVFIVKENRSFNNYFGTFPGAYGATSGPVSNGQVIPLGHTPDRVRDMGHDWDSAIRAMDNGKMDQFDLVSNGNVNGDYMSMSQYYQSDLPNYWAYAQKYVLSDETFSSLHGPSFPNHLYTIAADSAEAISNPKDPTYPQHQNWGCDAGPQTLVTLEDEDGVQTSVFPCFEIQTLGDLLESAGISWKYYAPPQNTGGYLWNAYDAIGHIRNNPTLWSEHFPSYQQFVTDAQNGTLPAVSWLIADVKYSEHPAYGVCDGENWTVQQINAVMQGPQWNSTAIFLTWDDFGGFYDPAPPPDLDHWGLGPRVPMLIISPYSISGKLDHTQYEFASVLKFIETRFNLGSLNARDTEAADMTAAFNFSQPPLTPLVLNQRTCPLGPIVTIAPSHVAFGNVVIGTTGTLPGTMTNSGDAALSIDSITLPNDTPFTQTNNCPENLEAGDQCTFTFTYKPTKTTGDTSKVTITDSASSSPQYFSLIGTGVSAIGIDPPSLDFGTQKVGTPSPTQAVTLTNNTTTTVAITSITRSGDYQQKNTCGSSLLAGAQCTVTVRFTPTATGLRTGTVSINSNAPGSPEIVPLTGTGQ